MTAAELESAAQRLRVVAGPVGPLHSYWDLIFDAEAIARGQPSLLAQEQVEAALAATLAELPA